MTYEEKEAQLRDLNRKIAGGEVSAEKAQKELEIFGIE